MPDDNQNSGDLQNQPNNFTSGEKVVQPSQEFVQELQQTQPASAQPAPPVENNAQTKQPGVEPSAGFSYQKMDGSALLHKSGNNVVSTGNPIVVYVLGALEIIFAVFTVLFASSNITGLVAFVDIAIGIGLILRKEIFRKIIVILLVVGLVLRAISFIGFVLVKQGADDKAARALSALETLKSNPSNQDQVHMQNIANLENTVNHDQASLTKKYNRLYLTYGLEMVYSFAVLIYFTRPKTKNLFS